MIEIIIIVNNIKNLRWKIKKKNVIESMPLEDKRQNYA